MTDTEAAIKRQMAEQVQESFAAALNTVTWALLRKDGRDAADDEKMLYAAFASAYHHLETGSVAEQQRAEWLISRVYAVLGNGAEALLHAKRCYELTEQFASELADYDLAFALEALARAHRVSGNAEEAATYLNRATEAGRAITDEESRRVFEEELK